MATKNQNRLPERNEIEDLYKWKLEDLFETDALWERAFSQVEKDLKKVPKFKGKLMQGKGEKLLKALEFQHAISLAFERVYVYARMRRDEDNANAFYQNLAARSEMLGTKLMTAWSFFDPEVLAGAEKIATFFRTTPALEAYRFLLEDLLRQKAHVLSDQEEALLAGAADALQTGDNVFTMFDNADVRFPAIQDEEGNETELTIGRFTRFLHSYDRNVRRRAFEALYTTYGTYRNTLAACYAGNVQTDWFYARTRKYASCLEAKLSGGNIPTAVYTNLIDTVHKGLPALNQYLEIRKRALNLPTLHMYDLYVPMVQVPHKSYTFQEGKEIVLKALAPLGAQYIEDLSKAFQEGWIDVYENRGKTTGAYSWGSYGVHPYVLLNWQGRLEDLFTLAHELGHAMHSHYSNRTQPYQYASYKIFVAEVASTVNENLLMAYLLQNCDDQAMRTYLINHYLEEFRTTVYRQTMFAEFEQIAHRDCEKGVPLTAEHLCKQYLKLNRKYYGASVKVDQEIALEWARIPHFYSAFYVYQYATGFSSAALIANEIQAGGEGAVERYLQFLSSGGSDYPIELLKIAGVDLSTPKPVEAALDIFQSYVQQLEEAFRE